MCEIKKLLFSVSEKGNPLTYLWVDDMNTAKMSDAIVIALKHQVAYLFFSGVGTKINLKKSKQYYNVDVPDFFTDIFENYKTSTNDAIKKFGSWMNNAFNNYFDSVAFLKNGEVISISQDECNNLCSEYLNGYFTLYNNVVENMGKSDNKALKNVAKILCADTAKASEVKDANSIVMNYTYLLNNYLNKQHYKIDSQS